MKFKNKGQLYTASEIPKGLDTEYEVFFYNKLALNTYLLVTRRIFTKDPYKYKYCILSEKRFRNICKGKKLQVAV